MSALLDQPPPAVVTPHRATFATRALRSLVVSVLIGLVITGATGQSLWVTVIESICIGMLCWFFIDSGRVLTSRWKHRDAIEETAEAAGDWPGWPLMLIVVVVGTFLAFGIGSSLATWITGVPLHGFFRSTWRETMFVGFGSLVPAFVLTYWFYSRGIITAQQMAVEAAQRQAAEIQLKLLESQLEPHMLFNTLANLRVLIGIDPPRAQLMLDQLIAFLRATLSASRAAMHPLSAEFARLADYLALMKIRMGDRLQAEFDLPPELADTPVPPLLLQPLVENSIKHGLEPKVAGGLIVVSATREGNELVLRVRDTGMGLSDAQSDGTHFGLVHVRERLATLYGNRGALSLQPAGNAAAGALATIRIPLPAES